MKLKTVSDSAGAVRRSRTVVRAGWSHAAAADEQRNWVVITSGFSMAIAQRTLRSGAGQGRCGRCEGMARNPGAAGAIRFALILGLALIESLALYTL